MLNLAFKCINILVICNNFCTLKIIHFDLCWFSLNKSHVHITEKLEEMDLKYMDICAQVGIAICSS